MVDSLPTASDLPASLLEYDQWLCWRTEDRDGKATKIPIDPTSGEFASTTDPETWASFATVREQVQFGTEDGVGFVFTDDDPFVGVDLDDCRDPDAGTIAAWANDVVATLDSYTEVSPSGTGFHVLVTGSLPDGRNRKGDVELYETARFFTVTGDHVAGTPSEIHERPSELESVHVEYVASDVEASDSGSPATVTAGRTDTLTDEELLEKATAAANGEKFERLWRGSTSGYESHSEADMALCSLLAFWTGGDPQQMDRLFRDSGLMRPKWDEQHYADGSTYGEKTIERAIAGTSEFYEPDEATSGGETAASAPTIELENILAREAERADRIDELEQRLNEVLKEKRELQDELEAEQARRKEIEAELDSIRAESDSLFHWFN